MVINAYHVFLVLSVDEGKSPSNSLFCWPHVLEDLVFVKPHVEYRPLVFED